MQIVYHCTGVLPSCCCYLYIYMCNVCNNYYLQKLDIHTGKHIDNDPAVQMAFQQYIHKDVYKSKGE